MGPPLLSSLTHSHKGAKTKGRRPAVTGQSLSDPTQAVLTPKPMSQRIYAALLFISFFHPFLVQPSCDIWILTKDRLRVDRQNGSSQTIPRLVYLTDRVL
jgi:hypothetical protein